MAIDKAVDSTQLDSDLTSVANAIRTKGGTSAQLAFPTGFVQAIGDIETGVVSNFESGEITIASDTETFVVPVSNLYTHFAVCRSQLKSAWTYASSARCVVSVWGTSSDYTVIDTNNTGGNYYIFDRQPSWKEDKITFTPTQVSCKALGNGNICRFSSGSKYVWVAWNEV